MNGLLVSAGPPVAVDEWGSCPHCGGDLEIHQPDCELPRRLLATCDDCKAWFITGAGRRRFRWLFDGGDRTRQGTRAEARRGGRPGAEVRDSPEAGHF